MRSVISSSRKNRAGITVTAIMRNSQRRGLLIRLCDNWPTALDLSWWIETLGAGVLLLWRLMLPLECLLMFFLRPVLISFLCCLAPIGCKRILPHLIQRCLSCNLFTLDCSIKWVKLFPGNRQVVSRLSYRSLGNPISTQQMSIYVHSYCELSERPVWSLGQNCFRIFVQHGEPNYISSFRSMWPVTGLEILHRLHGNIT